MKTTYFSGPDPTPRQLYNKTSNTAASTEGLYCVDSKVGLFAIAKLAATARTATSAYEVRPEDSGSSSVSLCSKMVRFDIPRYTKFRKI